MKNFISVVVSTLIIGIIIWAVLSLIVLIITNIKYPKMYQRTLKPNAFGIYMKLAPGYADKDLQIEKIVWSLQIPSFIIGLIVSLIWLF